MNKKQEKIISIVDSFNNGNINYAKNACKRVTAIDIIDVMLLYGYDLERAYSTAKKLKSK
jgi:hypothetical protein